LSFSLKKSFEGNRVKEERNNKFFNSLIFKKMQTAEKNAKGAQGATAKNNSSVKTANRPNLTGKEAKDENTQNQAPAKGEETKATQTAEVTAGGPAAMDNQPADIKEQPAAAELNNIEPKAETQLPTEEAKPVLSLDAKLKAVNDLHRKSIQRLALIGRIKTLEAFEVKLIEESDELESNPYQGCKLIIKDDKNREFVTNTPNLIRMVTQYIFDACNNKLEEIESTINFPQA
jgi:hypothetical protein